MKSNVRDVVKQVLTEQKDARDYDTILFLAVVEKYGYNHKNVTFLEIMRGVHNGTLPTFESITRARRKCQEEYPELRGSEKAQEARKNEEQEYKETYGR